uniref:Protein AF-9-like n=1 Tax=Psoroptes ovis TaxID=83912 RepID=A0A3B0QJA9_PSOOV|nr:protein AF-9-like [Psoroptes ovis]
MMPTQIVEVNLEIGHIANPKTKPTADGHTHDWTVFVRGFDNANINSFVEKVIFYLHDSFPKPKRVIKEPPYEIKESGYASFELPIDVYFRNKEEPKKLRFDYDLYIELDKPVINTRRERLTFQNPSAEFRKKLLKGRGVS